MANHEPRSPTVRKLFSFKVVREVTKNVDVEDDLFVSMWGFFGFEV